MITFYKLNDEEKRSFKSETDSEKQIKLLLAKNAELEEKIKYLEQKISFYETSRNIEIHENKPKNYTPERLFYNIGEVVKFGNYQWIVIDVSKEKALLLCKRCVKETNLFELTLSAKWDSSLSKKWKNSSIKKWLNDGFYYAFKNEEKEKIVKTNIDDSDNYFFILSRDELYNAINNLEINLFRFLEDKLWWLRTSENEKELYIVNNDSIEFIGSLGLRCGIRPAVYIKNQE